MSYKLMLTHISDEDGAHTIVEEKVISLESFTATLTVRRGLPNVVVVPVRDRKNRAKKYEEGKE